MPGHPTSVAVVIGDLVGSRGAADRRALHETLVAALDRVSTETAPVDPFAVSAGDEFQAAFARLGAALDAVLRLRVALLPDVDTRFGIGWGEVTRLDEHTQDGPAWWAAREAVEWVHEAEDRPGTRHARTAYRSDDPHAPLPAAVNAALLCRDHLMGSWDERSHRILRGLMSGHTQAEVAAAEGVSASAVSQRVRGDGIGVVLTAAGWLAELP